MLYPVTSIYLLPEVERAELLVLRLLLLVLLLLLLVVEPELLVEELLCCLTVPDERVELLLVFTFER